jgi:2-oxoglutarate ferredoxin oxidoreductase subunit delta
MNDELEREKPEQSESPPNGMDQIESPETSGKKYEIDIFKAWCKSCGICAAFCPRQCLGVDDEGVPVIVNSDRCTGCGWCELHCPDFAISVHPRKPKTYDEED